MLIKNLLLKLKLATQTIVNSHQEYLQRVNQEGEIRPTGRLIASKIVKSNIFDTERVNEGVTAILRRDDEITAIRISDSTANSVSANVLDNGSIDYSIRGRSRQNEEGIFDVCNILIKRLNRDGASWHDLEDMSQPKAYNEQGIDCQAQDGDKKLQIQVTRAETDQRVWRTLAQTGESSIALPADKASDALRIAIQKKASTIPTSERQQIILALDATETPSYVFQPVIHLFTLNHGEWAKQLRFQGIWLVGPIESLTTQLDS